MEYLEGRGIVHRDLAARNVLGKLLCLFYVYMYAALICNVALFYFV